MPDAVQLTASRWDLERSVAQTGACFRLWMGLRAEADDIVGPKCAPVHVLVDAQLMVAYWGLEM
jgi:hypothetical protein